MRKKNKSGFNIGTSLILVTFVLLCLVTFAGLTYISAKSDYNLSHEVAIRTNNYYDANRMAEIYLANIEALLSKHAGDSKSDKEYYDELESVFADNDRIEVTKNDDKTVISYMISVNGTQDLFVDIVAHYPDDKDNSLFYIEKWSTVTDAEAVESLKDKENVL